VGAGHFKSDHTALRRYPVELFAHRDHLFPIAAVHRGIESLLQFLAVRIRLRI
jgi:hypothetical protein